MGKAKFRPPEAPKPLNGFRWNLEYVTRSRVCPHMQIYVALRQRGWSGRTREKRLLWFFRYTFFNFFFLLYSSAHAEPAHVDRFWRSVRHTTCFRPRMCLFWVSFNFILLPIFWVKSFKTPILGAWIGIFKLNVQNIKICILSKLLHRLQPNFAQSQRPPSTLRRWSQQA